MPKKFKKTPFARRIRRMLEKNGIKADVEWRDHNGSKSIASNPCLRTIIYNSEAWIFDHSLPERPTMNDYHRVEDQVMQTNPGASLREIEGIIERLGSLVPDYNDNEILVTSSYSYGGYIINIPILARDMLGRTHEITLKYVTKSVDSYTRNLHQLSVRNELGAKRNTTRNGEAKPILLTGTLVAFLKEYEGTLSLLPQLMPEFEKELDQVVAKSDDHTAVTIEKLEIQIDDMTFILKAGKINIKKHNYKGVQISGDNVILEASIPESVALSAVGRPVGDVIKGMPFGKNTKIRKMKCLKAPWSGVSIKTSQKAMTIDQLVSELENSDPTGMAESIKI